MNLPVFDVSRNQFSVLRNPVTIAQLKSHGIEVASSPGKARILLGESRSQLLRAFLKGGWFKTCFLYTDEPGYDGTTTTTTWLIQGVKRMHVMNVFTGDVFTDAAGFIGSFGLSQPMPEFDEADIRRRFQTKRGASFITYRPAHETRRIVQGRDVDLNALRIQLSLDGQKRGIVDIFGSGFPPGVAMAATGWGATQPGEEWWDVKQRTLARDYAFNLCLENTDWPGYITEKLWQSIRAGCLPVYYGKNNGISRLMPADSYVEAADFSTSDQLFDFIQSMPFEEHLGRLYRCRDAYRAIQDEWHAGKTDTSEKRMARLAARLHQAADR